MPMRYDRKTILLHWMVVILFALVWGCAQIIDLFPKGPPKITVRSIHMMLGLVLGSVMLYRLWWRSRDGAHFPAVGLLPSLAKLVHFSLYLLILAEMFLGMSNVWGRGDVVFNLVKVPAFDPGNREMKSEIELVHAVVANLILALVALHVGAAFFHRIRKDHVFQRMLPGRTDA